LEKSFKIFFKRLNGQLNAQENGTKSVDVRDGWEDAQERMGDNRKFFFKYADKWPRLVKSDAITRGLLDPAVYSGRKDAKNTPKSAKDCLSRLFPSECEIM